MGRSRKATAVTYKVYVTPAAFAEISDLPGHIRQRIRQAIRELADNPRPAESKKMEAESVEGELRRIRLDRWRVVYVISEEDQIVDVYAIRKRPPYDYGDLSELIQ